MTINRRKKQSDGNMEYVNAQRQPFSNVVDIDERVKRIIDALQRETVLLLAKRKIE